LGRTIGGLAPRVLARLVFLWRPDGVTADIEIQLTVVVVIAERRARAPAWSVPGVGKPGPVRYISELSRASFVMEQVVAAVSRDEDVVVSIAVVIADCHALVVGGVLEAGAGRYVRERAVAIV